MPLTFLNDVIITITFELLAKMFLYLKIRALCQISGGVFNRPPALLSSAIITDQCNCGSLISLRVSHVHIVSARDI